MDPLVAKVTGRCAVVVPFQRPNRKSNVPTIEIGGKHYVLSTDGGPLGEQTDPNDHGILGYGDPGEGHAKLINTPAIENKWRFLWAYCVDSKQLAMWRTTDGNEKHFGRADDDQARIVRLEKRGELNRVTSGELRAIEHEMRRREDQLLQDLKHTIKESKSDFARALDHLAQEFFNHHVKPKLDKAIQDVHHGVIPLGFKPFGPGVTDSQAKLRQMLSYTLGNVFRREMSADKFEAFVRQKGFDPDHGDPQTIQWAIDDVYESLFDKYLPHYHRPHLASLSQEERSEIEATLEYCRSLPLGSCAGEDTMEDWLYDDVNPDAISPVVANVARRYASSYFDVGSIVLYGKWKNHHGKIVAFGKDKWGNPTIEIEPVPKGRKQNKIMNLYHVWRADVKENAMKEPKTASEKVAERFMAGSRLHMGPGEHDAKATASLRRIPLKAKNRGDIQSAVSSAGYYATKQQKTMYVYEGNSFMHVVWRVTDKASDYLSPINNTGDRVLSITPDLTCAWHEVSRPEPERNGDE